MIENAPTILNAPSIYNGGAGKSDDGPIIPDGFERLGAIYWKNTANTVPSSGVSILNSSNYKIVQRIYKPDAAKQNSNIFFFVLCHNDWNTMAATVSVNTYLSELRANNGGNSTIFSRVITPGFHDVILEQSKFTYDGNLLSSSVDYTSRNDVNACFPFPVNSADHGYPNPYIAMNEFKLIDSNDRVTCDIVGVKRLTDNKIGLFDTKKGEFYYSSYFGYYNV